MTASRDAAGAGSFCPAVHQISGDITGIQTSAYPDSWAVRGSQGRKRSSLSWRLISRAASNLAGT
jgi:hypothetical protein